MERYGAEKERGKALERIVVLDLDGLATQVGGGRDEKTSTCQNLSSHLMLTFQTLHLPFAPIWNC
jgi:hypothetical protein